MNQSEPEKKKTCILCDKGGLIQRGLCAKHYSIYRRAKAKTADHEVEAWERSLIEKGLILPDARPSTDPFTDALQELRASGLGTLGSQVAEVEPNQYSETPIKKKPAKRSAPNKNAAKSDQKRKQA